MNSLVKSVTLGLILLKAASAFAGEPSSGLDINDVAVLFPLDANKKAFPNISLEGKTPDKSLVLVDQFNQAMLGAEALGIAAPNGTVSIKKLSDWTVVAFRYDPCAPKDHAGPEVSDCMPELRLIAQPNDKFGPSDSALHLVYSLGESTPVPGDSAIADIFAAKAKAEALTGLSSSGLPLKVHPLLASAVASGKLEVGAIYENIVRTYAKPDKLKKITMFGLAAGAQAHWIFFGGNIEKGQWVQDNVPNISDNTKQFVELNLNSSKIFFPAPVELMTSTFGFFHREFLVADQYETLKVELHKLADPTVTNRNNADCLSCHSATSLQVNVRPAQFVEGVTALAPKGITAYPAPAILQRHRLNWNQRAFGYFGITPTLSLYTVNEAGRSAARVNEILSRVNPGRDCSAVQKAVISCFINTSANPSANGPTSDKCLETCAAATPALPVLPDSSPFPLPEVTPPVTETPDTTTPDTTTPGTTTPDTTTPGTTTPDTTTPDTTTPDTTTPDTTTPDTTTPTPVPEPTTDRPGEVVEPVIRDPMFTDPKDGPIVLLKPLCCPQ